MSSTCRRAREACRLWLTLTVRLSAGGAGLRPAGRRAGLRRGTLHRPLHDSSAARLRALKDQSTEQSTSARHYRENRRPSHNHTHLAPRTHAPGRRRRAGRESAGPAVGRRALAAFGGRRRVRIRLQLQVRGHGRAANRPPLESRTAAHRTLNTPITS